MTSRWRRALEHALEQAPAGLLDPAVGRVPVVVCVWRRPAGLRALVGDLLVQQGAELAVVLWSNHRGRAFDVATAAARLRAAGIPTTTVSSPTNLGGIARYVVARHLHARGWRGPVVTIDDDMRVQPSFVARLIDQWSPRSLLGVWAWRTGPGGYWDRTMVVSGTEADYVGAGGAVVDLDVFADESFFTGLPDAYGMIEDLWLTRWVRARGWRVVGADAPFHLDDDVHGLGHGIIERKAAFYAEVDAIVAGAPTSDPRPVALRQPSLVEVAAGLARGAARRVGVRRALLAARRLVRR